MNSQRVFLGIDVGTGGVRSLAATETGEVVARTSVPFSSDRALRRDVLHEQPPEQWWFALCHSTRRLSDELDRRGLPAERIDSLAVDGTSGTIVCLDGDGRPLRPAMMYNDGRAVREAEELNTHESFCRKLGYRFAASYAIAKILWIKRSEPEVFEKSEFCVHQSDYLLGQLTGRYDVSDYSNSLKTGYDLLEDRWPDWMQQCEGLVRRLPEVVAPGTPVGEVTAAAAEETGLPVGLAVVAGATDGTAGCIASGVRRPGDYNTTLGTTLVLKGLSRKLCKHPDGLIYSHKLPGGYWLPGAASNTGCEWISACFADEDLGDLDSAAAEKLPSPHVAYPLAARGERFPFLRPDAEGFCLPDATGADYYAACLQGVAFVERLCYAVLDRALDRAAESSSGEVFSTGGGSRSDVWMQCRADVTGRTIHRPACPEAAFGAAVLAASAVHFGRLGDAVDAMVRIERSFRPREDVAKAYDETYHRFLAELRKRGWL